ncbi:hypothetical protein HMPREF0591_5113 [Mycobacterium parascrofulaceum ATCC BAA-614]|uniref:Uncharacterized protein n=1 Tax=Mycobacterium parascrofulaceum ATCC BAA-614 TaxID=525368 RepID=D5PG19_9MYCO|nr:hypothetical protein HMPREF0591_5113 [Mycobacterium parascrofulaceum ATCC BAA-614]
MRQPRGEGQLAIHLVMPGPAPAVSAEFSGIPRSRPIRRAGRAADSLPATG